MRRFNPERELRKIQHGNRNRIIFSMIFGIILLAIGYSFAIYQVRYSKRIIYTKVAPFSSKDIELAVNIKGEENSDKFPTREEAQEKGIRYTGTECDNPDVTEVEWKEDVWKLNLLTSGPNKCTVSFGSTYTVKVVVESHGSVDKEEQEVQPNETSETVTISPEEEYKVKTITCTNNQQVELVGNTFKIKSVTSDTKCTITMGRSQSLFNYCITNEQLNTCIPKAMEDIALIEDDTKDNNIRYFGSDPNNYIWFNCDDYSGDMNETNCEKWRIIGLMKNVEKEDGSKEDLVKIRRADSVGTKNWSNTDSYMNKWPSASLNVGYLNSISSYLSETFTDTTNNVKGITSKSKTIIENVKWNISGSNSYYQETSKQLYEKERGYGVVTPETYPALIGLMYASDYGYATGGGNEYNRQICLSSYPYDWNKSPYKENCAENDWLYTGYNQWTITKASTNAALYVNLYGQLDYSYTDNHHSCGVHPTLYLKSSVKIKSGVGNGSASAPYVLVP